MKMNRIIIDNIEQLNKTNDELYHNKMISKEEYLKNTFAIINIIDTVGNSPKKAPIDINSMNISRLQFRMSLLKTNYN